MKNKELLIEMVDGLSPEQKIKFQKLFPDSRIWTWQTVYEVLGDDFLKAHPLSIELMQKMPEYIERDDISQFNKDHSKLKEKVHHIAEAFGLTYRDYMSKLGLEYKIRLSEKEKSGMTVRQQVEAHPNTSEIRKAILKYKKENGNLKNFSIKDPETHGLLNYTAQVLKMAPSKYVELLGIKGYYVRLTDKVKKAEGADAFFKSSAVKGYKAVLSKYFKENGNLDYFCVNKNKEYSSMRNFASRHGLSIYDLMDKLGYNYEEPKIDEVKFFKDLETMQKKGGHPGELDLDKETANKLRYLAFWSGVPEYDYLLENSDFYIPKVQVKLYDYIASTIKQLEEKYGKKGEGCVIDIAGVYKDRKLYERIRNIRRYTHPNEPIEYTIAKELGFAYTSGRKSKLGVNFPEKELELLAEKKYKKKLPLTEYESKRLNKLVFQKGTLLKLACRDVYALYGIENALGTHKEPNRLIIIREDITYDQHVKNMRLRDKRREKKKGIKKLADTIVAVRNKKEKELV